MGEPKFYTAIEGVEDLTHAARALARTERGRNALRRLLDWLDEDGLGLDFVGQEAALTLLEGAWGKYAHSARDAMRDALEFCHRAHGEKP